MKVFIKNKMLSLGEGSDVLNENQQPVFRVKGKVFSFTRKKEMYDMEGKLLYIIQNRFWNFFAHKAYIKNAEGQRLATIKKSKFSFNFNYKLEDCENEMSIEGKFFSRESRIMKNGQHAATILREFSLVNDAFSLEAEEQDIPFFTALVIGLDNIKDERDNDNRR